MLRNVKIKIIINHQPHHHAHHHHADHHLAIVGPRLPHHEVDLLLRQHLAQGGHCRRKVLKRTIIIILIVLLILATQIRVLMKLLTMINMSVATFSADDSILILVQDGECLGELLLLLPLPDHNSYELSTSVVTIPL